MKTSKSNRLAQIFIFLLIVLVPLGYSATIQESAMLPKYLGLCITLLISLVFGFKSLSKFPEKLKLSTCLLIAYLLFSSLSILGAINQSEAIFESSKVFLFALTFFITGYIIQKDKASHYKAIANMASLAILLAVFFSIKELIQAWQSREPFGSTVYLIKGLHAHKNLVSSWLLLLIPLALLGYWTESKKSGKKFLIAALVAALFILLLQSRASYTGLAIGLIVFLFFQLKKLKVHPKTWIYTFAGVTAVAILLILFTPLFENILSSVKLGSGSAKERLILWEKTIHLIKENPLWGTGGGNWKIIFPSQNLEGLYRAELNDVVFIRPHNDFLWIWSEYGLLSLLTFLGFIFTLFFHGLKKDNKEQKWIALCISGVIAYLAMAFFDFPKERIEHQIALAVLLALISNASQETGLLKIKPSMGKVITGISIVFCAYFIYQGFQRYEAETHITSLLEFKEKGNQAMLLDQGNQVNQNFVQMDNNAVPIDWYKGNALYNLGRQQEAAELYLKAAKLNPYNFNVLNNAGVACFIKNDFQQAKSFFVEVLRINPKHDDSRLNLASAYINLGDYDLASKTLDQLSTKSQRSESLKQMIEAR